jgi:exonuclease III
MTLNFTFLKIWFSGICWSFLMVSGSFAQQIYLDDDFRDWETIPALHTDKSGDGGVSGIDFHVLKMSNSDEYLYLYLEVSKFINIQASNSITIYVDTDNQSATGLNIYGIGADLSFNFGSRGGFYYSGSSTQSVRHAAIGLVTSPTVTSDRFEIAIKRKFNVSGTETFLQNRIKIVFSNETVEGDRLPDTNGGIEYLFSDKGPDITLPYSIDKRDSRHVRLMAYNVERDNFFNLTVRDEYRRIFNAIQPDIIGFSEIYNNSSLATAALVENLLPSSDGRQWYHAGVWPDIKLVSRYPIVDTRAIDGNGAFLLNMGSWQLVCIVTHLPCCENETSRQQEVDKIMAFVRDIRLGLSPFDVRQGTPVIIAGDMNFVGFREQLQTMLTGDIANNSVYGPDFRPDWDESDLDDVSPFVTDAPFTYTWYNPAGSFSVGRLDYIICTGSVLDIHNSFTLNTEVMLPQKRSAFGLLAGDTGPVSDHFPLVADFSLKGSISVNTDVLPSDNDSVLWSVYPNPSASRMIKVVLQNIPVHPPELQILSSEGKFVQKYSFTEGNAEMNINGENLTPGLYYFQLKTGKNIFRKAVYLN